jgi:hypothetical protein
MGEVGGLRTRFLNLSTNWRYLVSSQLNYRAALSLGKKLSVSVAKKPGWKPGYFICCGEEKTACYC